MNGRRCFLVLFFCLLLLGLPGVALAQYNPQNVYHFCLQSYTLSNNYPGVLVRAYDSTGLLVNTSYTGSDGSVNLLMNNTEYYTVWFNDAARSINVTWQGNPYYSPIYVWFWDNQWNPFGFISGVADSAAGYFSGNQTTTDVTQGVQTAVSCGDLPGGNGYFAALYSDTSGSTSSTDYTLSLWDTTTNDWATVDSQTVAGTASQVNFTITGAANHTYLLNIVGHSVVYGDVYRSAQNTFNPEWEMPTGTEGWPVWAVGYFALFLILGLAFTGTKRYELGVGVGLIAIVFVVDMLGMLEDFVPHAAVFVMLSLMVITVIIYSVAKWRREHGH